MVDPLDFFSKSSIARIQQINWPEAEIRKLDVSILREDEHHPKLSGNKFRKLKYHFIEAQRSRKTILSIGGPYSNLLYSLAVGGELFGIKTKGLLQGPLPKKLTPTLGDCLEMGMELEFLDRSEFKIILNDPDLTNISVAKFHWVPLGANDALGLRGTGEILNEIKKEFDYYICPVGTGNTLAGLVTSIPKDSHCLGVGVLHGLINSLLANPVLLQNRSKWDLLEGFEFGGFGKVTRPLTDFMDQQEKLQGIQTDQVYTGKMFFAINQLVMKDYFKPGSKLLMIHTGGLQGRRGMPGS